MKTQEKFKWNLSDIFKDEKAAQSELKSLLQRAVKFKKSYENELNHLSAADFSKALKEYEKIAFGVAKIMSFAYLKFAADTRLGGTLAAFEDECKKVEENLLFFELEFCDLDEKKARNFAAKCDKYGFWLENLLKNKKHNLSKKEERIMLYLSSTGARAFARLFDESMSALRVKFGGEILSEEEILSKLYHSDRAVRKGAAKAFSKALRKKQPLLTYIFNMIRAELRVVCELRGYANAETPRHISNQITQNSVNSLIKTTERNFSLVSKFYERKREILGLKRLKDYDRYAPIGKDFNISYEKAQKIVLEAFGAFSPEFAKIAKEAFDGAWLDVYPRAHKQGGAFSHSAVADAHPFVMLNFTGRRRDLFTLAHELGHAIHQKMSYGVNFLSQDTPLTTAETASVFAEMLVFDHLKKSLAKHELLGLYAAKIEDIFATLYRQINFTTFEREIHAKKGELTAAEFGEIWLKESAKMFGKSVSLTQNYALWFSYIPHFLHTPFYCYAYAYAQLLVLALYGLYKSGKCRDFVPRYINLLKSGGSKSPKDLIAEFGFDIESADFWELGISEIKKLVGEFLGIGV